MKMDINVRRKYTPDSPHQLLCLPRRRLTHHTLGGGGTSGPLLWVTQGPGGATGETGPVMVRTPQATVSSHQGHSEAPQVIQECRGRPTPSGAVSLATSSPSAPSAKPSCEPSLGRGEQRFPRSSGDVVYGCRRERSPRGSELPSSRRHACMNNRSSPDAGRLLCNFSRRLESLSRVLAEVTAHLSYSGRERHSSAGGDEMPARRHFLSSVGPAWRASARPLPRPLQLTRI